MKAIAALLLAISPLASAQTAEEIMSSVRQVAAFQEDQDLSGVIRKGNAKTPISLFLRGKDIQFALKGGAERFHLRLNENTQDLLEIVGGKDRPFPNAKIAAPIADTDVSYEDLALKFLYWPNPRIVGEEKLEGQQCWRLHVANPDKVGRYREISVWVSKSQRALMRVVGYGERPNGGKGQPPAIKQFEITEIMKVNDVFTVKTMKVSTFGKDNRVSGITYIEFENPKSKIRGRTGR
ncbi:outer membrane lipoprotein-sorting protein [Verrucomicrobiaceae bacterium 227]